MSKIEYIDKDPDQIFDIIEIIGEGSYGKVYKVLSREDGQIYAVKVVPVESDTKELEKEILILMQCKSPYIVSYHGAYQKDNKLWIVIEYCGGGSIADILALVRNSLDETQIASICLAILKGLEYLQSQKKIHRDIKSGNILLTSKGDIKLTDFGVSAQLNNTISKKISVIGTPYWMAPEVIKESKYDYRADIWSLGITAIEMAEGKPPLSGIHPMRAIFMIPNRPPPTLTNQEKWSKEFKDFVSQCLIKEQEQRPYAKALLTHPFIKKFAKDPRLLLVPLIEELNIKIQEAGGRQELFNTRTSGDDTAEQIQKDEDESGEGEDEGEEDDDDEIKKEPKNRQKNDKSKKKIEEDDSDDDSDDHYESNTLVHPVKLSKNKDDNQKIKDEIIRKNKIEDEDMKFLIDHFSQMSVNEIEDILENLDIEKKKEIDEVNIKYEKKREVLKMINMKKNEKYEN
jgi:serine/threonine protein kinase